MMEVTATTFTITCAILCAILSIVFRRMGRRRLYELASKFDGPPTLPLIGNAHLFIGNGEDNLKRLREIVNSYSAPFRIWMAHRLYIGVTDPKQIETILMSPKAAEKGYAYEFIKSAVGPALISAPGPQWRELRKIIEPTFNTKILNNYVKVFDTQSKILVGKMEAHVNGPEFETLDLVALATLAMLCGTLMDTEMEVQSNPNLPYVGTARKVFAIASKRIFSVWLHPDSIFNRTQLGKEERQSVKIMRDFSDSIIRRKEDELRKRGDLLNPADGEDDECEPTSRRDVFINHLLKMSHGTNRLSNKDLHNSVNELMIDGHESVAIIFSYVALLLASHPEIQDKVYLELSEIYGDDKERELTHEDLSRMKYLENVIKETLRLFPLGTAVSRTITDDLDIGDGHTLPGGSEVLIPVLEIHRNEKHWPDPMKFDPDRFLPEEVAKRHTYTYLPFSRGPRNCLGIKYAMMVIKTLAATILRRYTLRKDNIVPVKDIRLKLEVLMKPVDPVTVRIERRVRI